METLVYVYNRGDRIRSYIISNCDICNDCGRVQYKYFLYMSVQSYTVYIFNWDRISESVGTLKKQPKFVSVISKWFYCAALLFTGTVWVNP